MKKTLLYLVLLIVALGLIAPGASAKWWHPDINVKVMTRNLYLGADIFKVVQASQIDPGSVPLVVAEVFQTMLYTNFWARAEAIADEIARNKPDVVGLQEVSTYYIQTPGDSLIWDPVEEGLIPNPDKTTATDIVIDFYTILDAAMKARGLYYKAFSIDNADVELPMADPNAGPPYFLSDVRLVDHDVVLVRRGIPAWEVLADNYENNLGLELGGSYVEFTRGFVIVDAIIMGKIFRFVNTHLEVRSSPYSIFRVFQSAQMQELLITIDTLSETHFLGNRPIIMLGDFNSSEEDVPGIGYPPYELDEYGFPLADADEGTQYIPPYMMAVRGARYLDAWLEQTSYDEGYTSGFDEYIDDPNDSLETRIDLIFLDPLNLAIKKVKCKVVGDKETDMVSYPDPDPDEPDILLWPSDHAGVVAKIKFSKPYRPWWLRFRWSPK